MRKGGDTCLAQEGRNAYHAVLGNRLCAIGHPSDLAVPLVAHGATAEVLSRAGRRTLRLEALFVAPEEDFGARRRPARPRRDRGRGAAAVALARPLAENGHKVALREVAVRRALLGTAGVA